MTLGYLDDLNLMVGKESTVAADVELIVRESESLQGLHLNHSKCEIISRSDTSTKFNNIENFKPVKPKAASLLGSLLSDSEALEQTLESHCKNLCTSNYEVEWHRKTRRTHPAEELPEPLGTVAHAAMSPLCIRHPLLKAFDYLLQSGLEIVLNLYIVDSHWPKHPYQYKS